MLIQKGLDFKLNREGTLFQPSHQSIYFATVFPNTQTLSLSDNLSSLFFDHGDPSATLSLDPIHFEPFSFEFQGIGVEDSIDSFQLAPALQSPFLPYLNTSITPESPVPYLVGLVVDGPLPSFEPFQLSLSGRSGGGFSFRQESSPQDSEDPLDGENRLSPQDNQNFSDGSSPPVQTQNDAPTDIQMSDVTIGENAKAGDLVGTLSAVDFDSIGPFTYSLVGGDTDKFELVGTEVRVKTGANLDFETQDLHALTIEVQDAGGATYQETFQIQVTNEFEASVGQVMADHNLQTISFSESYTNPVVFAFLSTTNGGEPAIARVQNVTANSFDLSLTEPSNMDGWHHLETVNYFVAEAGKWELSDGTLFEVGTFSTNQVTHASGFETLNFSQDFTHAPVTLTQVQTNHNGVDFLKNRQHSTTQDAIELALETEESATHLDLLDDETIGYFAIDSTTGDWNGTLFESGVTGDEVTDDVFLVPYDQGYEGEDAIFFGSIATFDGTNAATLRGEESSATSQKFYIEEDTTKDSETTHITEKVSYLVFGESSDSLGEGVSAVPYSIDVSDGVMLEDFGHVSLNHFSTGQTLSLESMLDVNNDGFYNLEDLALLESSGELVVSDDGTDVTLDFSVGSQAGGTLELTGLSESASQPINSVQDLIDQVNVVVTP